MTAIEEHERSHSQVLNYLGVANHIEGALCIPEPNTCQLSILEYAAYLVAGAVGQQLAHPEQDNRLRDGCGGDMALLCDLCHIDRKYEAYVSTVLISILTGDPQRFARLIPNPEHFTLLVDAVAFATKVLKEK